MDHELIHHQLPPALEQQARETNNAIRYKRYAMQNTGDYIQISVMKFPQILIGNDIWRNVFVECQGKPMVAGCSTPCTYYADVIVY